MSFILDALKKADQQRQGTLRPNLHTLLVTPSPRPRPGKGLIILIALILLGLGIAIGSLQPWLTDAPVPAVAEPASEHHTKPAPATEALAAHPAQAPAPLPASPPAAQIAPSVDVIQYDQLPASLRATLPPLVVQFHVYAREVAERRVMLDNLMLSQGALFGDGLSLEEITPNGIVLTYRGYRFRRDAF